MKKLTVYTVLAFAVFSLLAPGTAMALFSRNITFVNNSDATASNVQITTQLSVSNSNTEIFGAVAAYEVSNPAEYVLTDKRLFKATMTVLPPNGNKTQVSCSDYAWWGGQSEIIPNVEISLSSGHDIHGVLYYGCSFTWTK